MRRLTGLLAACGVALLLPTGRILAQSPDRFATFFVGRLHFGSNNGDDCADVGQDLVKLVSRTSNIPVQEQRLMGLRDEALYETPFVFMNGHNDFVLSEEDLSALRRHPGGGWVVSASG